jgi:hypothetical protein
LVIDIPGPISVEIIDGKYCYGKRLSERNMAGIAERPEGKAEPMVTGSA